jgi:trehalose/maltose hydrolase-like predicted phosphorylase
VRIPGLENEEPPVNTWPLFNKRQTFATISGFWNSMESGESSIAGIPHFTDLLLEVCGTPLNAAVDENSIWDFQTSMSFKTGLATWVFKWSPVGCTRKVDLDVRFEVFLSSDARQVAATKLSITASRDCNAIVTDLLDGRGAVRSTVTKKGLDAGAATIYAEVKPYGMEDVVAFLVSSVEFTSPGVDHASRRDASALTYIESHDATVGQTYDVRLTALSEMTVFKYVGIASSDHFPDPEATARNASSSAAAIGWSKLLDAHILVVRKIMHPDLLADFARPDGSLPSNDLIRNMHIIAKTSAFYLWHNLLPTNGSQQNYTSISVGGLSSDSYAGKIFWDADIFMAPGIMASHPSLAKQIAQYRISRAPQAARNAEALGYTPGSLIYPWTSSRLGECFDGSAKCAGYQYHLNTDIALSLVMLRNVSGDTKWFRDEALPVIDGIAQMLEQLVEYNALTGRWEVHGMTEPDEFYVC